MPTPRVAETVRRSLEPETRVTKGFRTKTRVSSRGRQVRLRIEADDLAALRAASNSFLHFTAVAAKTVETVAPFYRGRRRP